MSINLARVLSSFHTISIWLAVCAGPACVQHVLTHSSCVVHMCKLYAFCVISCGLRFSHIHNCMVHILHVHSLRLTLQCHVSIRAVMNWSVDCSTGMERNTGITYTTIKCFLESGQLLSYFANLLISGSGPCSGILLLSLKGQRTPANLISFKNVAIAESRRAQSRH